MTPLGQGGPAIPALGRENLKHLAFVIHRKSEIMRLAVDPDEHFVQVPTLLGIRSMINPPLPDLRGEHRTKPVPPKPRCFVADIDTALEQQIFYPSRGRRITDLQHHREADHLGRRVEIAKRITHRRRLRNATPRLKPIYSDNANHTTGTAERDIRGIGGPTYRTRLSHGIAGPMHTGQTPAKSRKFRTAENLKHTVISII